MHVKRLILSTSFMMFIMLLSARSGLTSRQLDDHLYTISYDMINHYVETADRLDSLKATLTDDALAEFSPHFDYIQAFEYYMKGYQEDAMRFAGDAIVEFMYRGDDRWSAKCMMLIGYVSNAMLLFPEAVKGYERVTQMSSDPYILGAAYLNMARTRKTLKLDWEENFKQGLIYAKASQDEALILYSQLMTYWLHPDSADMTTHLPIVADRFHEMEIYSKEADAYKCLVFHYIRTGEYNTALAYVGKCIDTYSLEDKLSKSLLASAKYLEGKILFLLGDRDLAYESFNEAIRLNRLGHYKESNYNIYRSLYKMEYQYGNLVDACMFADKAITSYEYVTERRVEHFQKMTFLFKKIDLVEYELIALKRKSTARLVLVTVLLFTFFITIIMWFRARKRHYEKLSNDMVGKNMKLKAETGELLAKANQNKVTSNIITNQSAVERKMSKLFAQNEILPDIVKERYAETLLLFDVKLPMLTGSEKRYAVMIALNIPYKTIAELLNVKPETVAQYRNRIRKKLGISNTNIDLNIYLQSYLEA